ncbi:MAG: hypothetical protein ACR2J0_05535, partial [Mycobacteriales bacterium]
MIPATVKPPEVDDRGVRFRLADAGSALTDVRLVGEVRLPGDRRSFARTPDGDKWELLPDRTQLGRL